MKIYRSRTVSERKAFLSRWSVDVASIQLLHSYPIRRGLKPQKTVLKISDMCIHMPIRIYIYTFIYLCIYIYINNYVCTQSPDMITVHQSKLHMAFAVSQVDGPRPGAPTARSPTWSAASEGQRNIFLLTGWSWISTIQVEGHHVWVEGHHL